MTNTQTVKRGLTVGKVLIHIIERIKKVPYGTDDVIEVSRISIPIEFRNSHPSPQKIKIHTKFYIDNGYFDKPILVQKHPDKNSNIVFLRDGYIRYRIAILNNFKTVPIRWYDNKGDK
jgi:hypothetical protein